MLEVELNAWTSLCNWLRKDKYPVYTYIIPDKKFLFFFKLIHGKFVWQTCFGTTIFSMTNTMSELCVGER